MIRLDSRFYCLCVFWGILFNAIGTTQLAINYSGILIVINWCLLLLMLLQLFRIMYILKNKKQFLLWIMCLLLLFISYRISNDRTIIETYIYITAASYVDFKKIRKTVKKSWEVIATIVIVLAIVGVFPSAEGYRESGVWRSSLGFAHPNTLGFVLFTICTCVFIDNYQKIKWRNLLKMVVLTMCNFFIANSRASSLIMTVLILLAILKLLKVDCLKNILESRTVRTVSICLSLILLVLSIFLAKNYDSLASWGELNMILNGRLNNGAYFYQNYSPNFFGQVISEFELYTDNFTKLYLDSGYLLVLLRNGIFSALVLVFLFGKALRRAALEKNVAVAVIIILLTISLIVEQTALRWCYCWILTYGFAITNPEDRKNQYG